MYLIYLISLFPLKLLKKLVQVGETSCLRPLLALAEPRDRTMLQKHCRSAARRFLEAPAQQRELREAVAYLSIAIMASGGYNITKYN